LDFKGAPSLRKKVIEGWNCGNFPNYLIPFLGIHPEETYTFLRKTQFLYQGNFFPQPWKKGSFNSISLPIPIPRFNWKGAYLPWGRLHKFGNPPLNLGGLRRGLLPLPYLDSEQIP